ncbi:MAG TPA: hypothetical protein VKR22_10270 [Acidimicrobiales bacterium]|nr:hypothetical protein [Acidimicrobiales bacterium]
MEHGVDPAELLERLHADKRSLIWEPLAPSTNLGAWYQRPMQEDAALEYLHQHWALPDRPDSSGVGRGPKGILVRLLGRLAFRVLGPYLRAERELLAHMVRTNDALARRCDELAHAIATRQVDEAENNARLAAWLQVHADGSLAAGEAGERAKPQ